MTNHTTDKSIYWTPEVHNRICSCSHLIIVTPYLPKLPSEFLDFGVATPNKTRPHDYIPTDEFSQFVLSLLVKL